MEKYLKNAFNRGIYSQVVYGIRNGYSKLDLVSRKLVPL